MDAAHLTQAIAVVTVAAVVGRFVLTDAGRAQDGIAMLFVPPDRALGWPHGVQEGDEPWGWRPGRTTPDDVIDAAGTGDGQRSAPPGPDAPLTPPSDRYVLDVGPIDPITLRARPH